MERGGLQGTPVAVGGGADGDEAGGEDGEGEDGGEDGGIHGVILLRAQAGSAAARLMLRELFGFSFSGRVSCRSGAPLLRNPLGLFESRLVGLRCSHGSCVSVRRLFEDGSVVAKIFCAIVCI